MTITRRADELEACEHDAVELTKPRYLIRVDDETAAFSAESEQLTGALDAAWALQRFTERPVVIVDRQQSQTVARVNVEWVGE